MFQKKILRQLSRTGMKNALKTAKRYVEVVEKSGIPITTAFLYGSYAKKSENEGSDIDVCIVSPIFGKDYLKESVNLRMLTLKVDSKIEPVAFNPKDINNKFDSLASEIKRTGINLTS